MSTPRRPAPRSSGTPMRAARPEVDGSASAFDNRESASMGTPSSRKAAPAGPTEGPDLVGVLVTRGVLNPEQADRVRRAQKVGGLSAEQAVIQLGFAGEVQIAQALAA